MGKKHVIKKAEEGKEAPAEVKKEAEKINVRHVDEGRVFINSSYNNTIITLSDKTGNVLGWASSGGIGFKGSKKATPFAASKVAETVALIAQKLGIQKIAVFVKGIGSGRESAIRSLAAKGFDIISIKDETPIPHNGCRPPKTRRV
jgi:small subunit ribosomal protein S11